MWLLVARRSKNKVDDNFPSKQKTMPSNRKAEARSTGVRG